MIRCRGQEDNNEAHRSSSSKQQQLPEHHSFSTSSASSRSSFDYCSWLWGWMTKASAPSTASLMMYPSCGGDDHDAAVEGSATSDETLSPHTTDLCATITNTALDVQEQSHYTTNTLEAMVTSCGEDGETNDYVNAQEDVLYRSLATLLRQETPLERILPNIDVILVGENNASTITKIRHVAQRETWDCGVACMQMIFDWLTHDHNENDSDDDDITTNRFYDQGQSEREWMLKTIGTTSIWTIDLVCLLEQILSILTQQKLSTDSDDDGDIPSPPPSSQQLKVASYLFLSKTLGVNDSHSGIRYYQRGFLEDQRRVEALFQRARHSSPFMAMPILQYPHVSLEVVLFLVSRPHCIAMVLVDNSLLQDVTKNRSREHDTYQGHYVLLCGISTDAMHLQEAADFEHQNGGCNSNELLDGEDDDNDEYCLALLNPARSDPQMEFVSPGRFERAWRATGTDDDIVFIVKHAATTC